MKWGKYVPRKFKIGNDWMAKTSLICNGVQKKMNNKIQANLNHFIFAAHKNSTPYSFTN